MPASSTHRRTPSGDSSMATPRASSTSAVPHWTTRHERRACTPAAGPGDDECGHGRHVDRVRRSPPVPTTSTARSRRSSSSGTSSAAERTASSRPDSSSAVSPSPAGRRRSRSAGPRWPAQRGSSPSPTRLSAEVAAGQQLGEQPRPAAVVREQVVVGPRRSRRRISRGASGAATPLADDPTTLALGGAAPHAGLLPREQRMFETGGPTPQPAQTALAAAASSSSSG